MKTYKLRHSGLNYEVSSSDGVAFDIGCELYADGNYLVFAEKTALQESSEHNDDINAVIRLTKNLIKAEKARTFESIGKKLEVLGSNVGTRKKHIDLDNRSYYAMKRNNIVMNQFINLAIAEKLERDGLLTDNSNEDI